MNSQSEERILCMIGGRYIIATQQEINEYEKKRLELYNNNTAEEYVKYCENFISSHEQFVMFSKN